ncbi:MAG: SUMF1/EgtB/PvdO family nonheme iron enzyme [Terriglobales bacterium]
MLTAEKSVRVPHDLVERVLGARRRSDALFSLVREDALYERPIPERHRIIFYLGHLEAFDWNLLHQAISPNPRKGVPTEFDRLFAFGIDPVGGGLPTDVPSDWPSVDVVRDYVTNIRDALDVSLANTDFDDPSHARDGFPLPTLLNVAIEHRLMHVETLAYMLHQLPFDKKIRQADPQLSTPPVVHRTVAVPAGPVALGLARSSETFGWDNEFEAHTVEVRAFEIDQYKVTNRQYLEFVTAGGYETRAFWNEDDWNWKNTQGISHPAFWKKQDNRWLWRGMFDEIAFDGTPAVLDWPVYVSHAEAGAYARWAGKWLPTEAEWQRAAYGNFDGRLRAYPWGNKGPNDNFSVDRDPDIKEKLGNFNFQRWNPTPVNAFPDGQSAFGVDDMLGNGWEWTSTAFAPFPGFEPFPFYRGYSADFFDGKHFVMKGASPRTAACMLRPTFRNWFQAHYQYVYAGFRCVRR